MQNVIKMEQVHGNSVVRVDSKDIGATISQCDAMITTDPNVTLCVRVADCLPISVVDKKGRGVGLIHAGWRGLDNGIIYKTIKAISEKLKVKCENLEVVIGPHICQKCYEVKNDVSSKFSDYPEAVLTKNGKEYLDLAKVAQTQMIMQGINPCNIKIDKRCTFEDPLLFSYRRNKTDKRNFIYLTLPPARWKS